MEYKEEKTKQIDVVAIAKMIWQNKKAYIIVLPVVAILSYLIIVCVPRTYTSTVKLAPELSSFNSSSLSDIASSFGFDMGTSKGGGDALFPELYPDLIQSNDFITSLFDVKVKSKDGKINTTYYNYLSTMQKAPWWTQAIEAIKNIFASKEASGISQQKINPFMLTKKQDEVAKCMGALIKCSVDKKDYVISISVDDQDPLICATIADTVRARLQQFITEYRTSKARTDLEYYQKMCKDAKEKYEKVRRTYGSYSDANQDVVLESFKLKENDLENEMQLLYNNYTALTTQVQQAQAKLLMQTPAFTTLQNASVPLKPTGPKRMIFALGMTLLAFIIITFFSVRKVIFGEID